MDKQKAIECYQFFNGHFYRCKSNQETFLPGENIRIFFDLKDESKREVYEQILNNKEQQIQST